MNRTLPLALLFALAVIGLLTQWRLIDPLAPLLQAKPAQPTVLFVVLDTVRADRLSLCGYALPTSPTLDALAADGAIHTCSAYAPGSWTLPSHASYFTGLDLPAHGAHPVPGGVAMQATAELARPLPEAPETLAEAFAARGYQTAALSANPVLSAASGLLRGFGWTHAPDGFGPMHGGGFEAALLSMLRGGLDRDRPLFLFVNIADAHQPWDPVPDGLGWLPPRDGFHWEVGGEEDLWAQWFKDELSAEAREALLAQLSDVYDHGVYQADANLGLLLDRLEAYGWLTGGLRLVVTSDHGELLGEHDMIDHGHTLWEENQRVPVLTYERDMPLVPNHEPLPPLAFPDGPVSALVVHSLVSEGRLPWALPEVSAAAFPHPTREARAGGVAFGQRWEALWLGEEKLVRVDGEGRRYELAQDPGELRPLNFRESDEVDVLEDYVRRVDLSLGRATEVSPELQEALRAAGYLDGP